MDRGARFIGPSKYRASLLIFAEAVSRFKHALCLSVISEVAAKLVKRDHRFER
jgi:predicted MFS family arabinose efflux permease